MTISRPSKGTNRTTLPCRRTRYPRVTREQLLAASDIKSPHESRWAEHGRGEALSPAKARRVAAFEVKATRLLNGKTGRTLTVQARRNLFLTQECRSENRHRLANRTRTGHAARRPTNSRQVGSRRAGASSRTSSADPGGDPPPEPKACLHCGEPIPSSKRADAEFCGEAHSKAYRRKLKRLEASAPAQLPTLWADEDRVERDAWRALGDRERGRKLFRPTFIDDTEDDIDPQVRRVWLEETAGRVFHGRHVRMAVVA